MIPLIYTFDWFKRDKNFTTSNKEIKLNWETGLNDKFSAFLYKNSQVNMLLKKKSELIEELCGIGHTFGINKKRILINDKNSNSMTNNKSIIISNKFENVITNNYDKLDLIIGLFCHECAHCLYSDFKFINSSNRIIKWFQNVIEDELIESKLGQTYPGYINFISKVKYYYFDLLKNDIIHNKKERNDLDKIMKIFLLVIRYPKYLDEIPENELIEYADLFDKIYDILKSNMCLNPDRNNMCTSWSFRAAQEIYNIIKDYINKKYPNRKKKNKSYKKNNNFKGFGSEENEDKFNDSSDEMNEDNESSEDFDEDNYNNSSEEDENYNSENEDDDLSEEDFDSEDELFDKEENSDKNNSDSDSDYDSEDELFNDEDEDSDEENNIEYLDDEDYNKSDEENKSDEDNNSESNKTSFDKMEDEVNNNEDSIENLYDKATEDVKSSSEENTDLFSSNLEIEEEADKIEKEFEIEERESLNINIKENESLNEISNYNEVYNLIRPYITFAKEMIIQNEASDVLNPEHFRRNGMLDTRKIAEAYMGCKNVFTQNIQRKKRNQNSRYALVIMLDESGSMGYRKIFDFTTQLAVLIYETIKLYKDMEIYIYGHGDWVVPYITKNKIEKEALAIRRTQGDQDEPTSYKVIIEDVKKQTNLPIIAINITDSLYCYNPENIKQVVNEYKKQHVNFNLICCGDEATNSIVSEMNNDIYGYGNWISIDQLGNKFKSSMKILGQIIARNYNS